MNINSSRNLLVRSANLRSARRSRRNKALNRDASSVSSSLNQISAKKTSSSTSTSASSTQLKQITMYEKMEKSASEIQSDVKNMLTIGKMSYTDDETGKKAHENDRESLISGIKSFITDYNLVHSALDDISGMVNLAFRRTLDSTISIEKTALGEIGISISKDGVLSIDEKALSGADEEKIKALFAKEDCFADKISTKMKAIESSASNSLTALNKLYGSTSTYNQYGVGNSCYNGSYYNSSSWYY